jgi:hypothetical protein
LLQWNQENSQPNGQLSSSPPPPQLQQPRPSPSKSSVKITLLQAKRSAPSGVEDGSAPPAKKKKLLKGHVLGAASGPAVLWKACKAGDLGKVEAIVRALTKESKGDVDLPNNGKTGKTPLHIAVENGNLEVKNLSL